MKKDPSSREVGTDSLVDTYTQDTPGQSKIQNLYFIKTNPKITKIIENVRERVRTKVIINPDKKKIENILPHGSDLHHTIMQKNISFASVPKHKYDNVVTEMDSMGSIMANHNQGGGKKREGLENNNSHHIISQLRMVKNLRDPDGSPVIFNDKSCYLVDEEYAIVALKIYESLLKPCQKEICAQKLAKSPQSFIKLICIPNEEILDYLEESIKEQKKQSITLATKVGPELSCHRLQKVILEDCGNVWVSSLIFNNGEVHSSNTTKEEGIFGLNKLRRHIQENVADHYQVIFEDKTQ